MGLIVLIIFGQLKTKLFPFNTFDTINIYCYRNIHTKLYFQRKTSIISIKKSFLLTTYIGLENLFSSVVNYFLLFIKFLQILFSKIYCNKLVVYFFPTFNAQFYIY